MTNSARVAIFDQVGGPEVLRITQIPLEAPTAGQVQVRIDAIGLNRVETLFRAGFWPVQPTLPASRLGFEAAGTVELVGEGVEHVKPGDPVTVLSANDMSRYGVYADVVNLPATTVSPRSAAIDAVTAAGLWVAYLTAYGTLVEAADVHAGEFVLITAASSAVGLAAIQVARQVGAIPVAVTRTSAKAEQLRAAGAAHVIARDGGDLVERVREITGGGAEVALDAVGGPGLTEVAHAVQANGRVVVYGFLDPRPTPFPMNWPLRVHGFDLEHMAIDPLVMGRAAQFLSDGLTSGALVPTIGRTFDFEEIAAAHRYLESNDQVGKIVVTVQH
jgi:NADPH:quinone reductase-like Zn-dependent oxidoreductase